MSVLLWVGISQFDTLNFNRTFTTDTHPSRQFYQLEALKNYKWYWRLEPNVEFSCAITYDPFVQMAKHHKVYGYVIALWEVGRTCPSLFRTMADWMEAHGIRPTSLWKGLIEASWAPSPFRMFMKFLAHRDRHGDAWSLCHYWSNFEIADLDFFRSQQYQQLFEHLDHNGGFYYERVSFPRENGALS